MFIKGKIPVVRLLIPLIGGIAAAKLFPARFIAAHGLMILVSFFIVAGLTVLFYKHFNFYRRRWIPGTALHLLVFFMAYQLVLQKSSRFDPRDFSAVKGNGLVISVNTEPSLSNDILRFESHVKYVLHNREVTPATGKLLVALKPDRAEAQIKYGDLLLIPSRFTEVEPPYNPGEFNYKVFLHNKQIHYQTFIKPEQIIVLQHDAGNPVISYALALRHRLVGRFTHYIENKNAAAVASTLILGYRADLNKDVVDAYSKTGTMHILSVSGMHVALVFWIIDRLLKGFDKRKKLRLLKPVLVIPLIWFYALITGFSPSVCRAVLMLTFYVLGKTLNRSHNSYNLIAISAFFLLIYNPYYLFDIGFQLSYLAVLGLIYLHPKIYHLFYVKNWLFDKIWSFTALSIAAQLATFPLSIYYFHQFPVYFLISNLLIVIPVTVIMYLGFVFLLIPVDGLSAIFGSVLSYSITWVNNGLLYIETMPFSTFNDLWINAFEFVLIYCVIGMVIWAFQFENKRMLITSLFSFLILTASFVFRSLENQTRHQLIFYSLRKNTAIGYVNGKKGSVITDLPQADKTVSFSIQPALSSNGVARQIFHNDSSSVNGMSVRHFYKFADYKVLKWDRSLDFKNFTHPIKVDAILLTSNSRVNIQDLQKQVRFSILLIDGSNSDYRTNRWQSDAKRLGVKHYVLKKNPAFIVDL